MRSPFYEIMTGYSEDFEQRDGVYKYACNEYLGHGDGFIDRR
jgi:hypothetical protein